MQNRIPRMASEKTLLALAIRGHSGRYWYHNARQEIARVAAALGCSPSRLAAVLAVTSPRVHVSRNARITLAYLRAGALPDGVLPAARAAMAHYEATGEIRGPKTGAFAANLSGDETQVVLDVWMSRALRIPQGELGRPAVYRRAAARVVAVARTLGWTPAETQAAIWTAAYRDAYSVPNVPDMPLVRAAQEIGLLP